MIGPLQQIWIDSLRSGKFRRTSDYMIHRRRDGYCYYDPLGVGIEVLLQFTDTELLVRCNENGVYGIGRHNFGFLLPPRVRRLLGLSDRGMRKLMALATADFSLPAIGKLMESNPKDYFFRAK